MPLDSPQDRYRMNRCQSVDAAMHDGYTVQISCKGCGNRRIVEAAPLWRLAKVRLWPTGFIELGNHMKCGRCRAKYPEVRASCEPVDSQPPVGYRTERDALEAARRMRG